MQRFLLDTLERTARTFVQGFLGVVTMDAFSQGFDPSFWQTLGMGALAGLYAVLTAFASKPVGRRDTASVLPEEADKSSPEKRSTRRRRRPSG